MTILGLTELGFELVIGQAKLAFQPVHDRGRARTFVNDANPLPSSPDILPGSGFLARRDLRYITFLTRQSGRIHASALNRRPQIIAVNAGEVVGVHDVVGAAVDNHLLVGCVRISLLGGNKQGAGVAAIIYTDIDRDGLLSGINWQATIALADAVAIPVIASGGLASMADIERMTQPDAARLEGAISGRALYDGRLEPAKALAMLRHARSATQGTVQ